VLAPGTIVFYLDAWGSPWVASLAGPDRSQSRIQARYLAGWSGHQACSWTGPTILERNTPVRSLDNPQYGLNSVGGSTTLQTFFGNGDNPRDDRQHVSFFRDNVPQGLARAPPGPLAMLIVNGLEPGMDIRGSGSSRVSDHWRTPVVAAVYFPARQGGLADGYMWAGNRLLPKSVASRLLSLGFG